MHERDNNITADRRINSARNTWYSISKAFKLNESSDIECCVLRRLFVNHITNFFKQTQRKLFTTATTAMAEKNLRHLCSCFVIPHFVQLLSYAVSPEYQSESDIKFENNEIKIDSIAPISRTSEKFVFFVFFRSHTWDSMWNLALLYVYMYEQRSIYTVVTVSSQFRCIYPYIRYIYSMQFNGYKNVVDFLAKNKIIVQWTDAKNNDAQTPSNTLQIGLECWKCIVRMARREK